MRAVKRAWRPQLALTAGTAHTHTAEDGMAARISGRWRKKSHRRGAPARFPRCRLRQTTMGRKEKKPASCSAGGVGVVPSLAALARSSARIRAAGRPVEGPSRPTVATCDTPRRARGLASPLVPPPPLFGRPSLRGYHHCCVREGVPEARGAAFPKSPYRNTATELLESARSFREPLLPDAQWSYANGSGQQRWFSTVKDGDLGKEGGFVGIHA